MRQNAVIMMFQKTTLGRNSRLESDKQLFVKCIVFITTYLDLLVLCVQMVTNQR